MLQIREPPTAKNRTRAFKINTTTAQQLIHSGSKVHGTRSKRLYIESGDADNEPVHERLQKANKQIFFHCLLRKLSKDWMLTDSQTNTYLANRLHL